MKTFRIAVPFEYAGENYSVTAEIDVPLEGAAATRFYDVQKGLGNRRWEPVDLEWFLSQLDKHDRWALEQMFLTRVAEAQHAA